MVSIPSSSETPRTTSPLVAAPAEAPSVDLPVAPGPDMSVEQVAGGKIDVLKQVLKMLRGGEDHKGAADGIREQEYNGTLGRAPEQPQQSPEMPQDAPNDLQSTDTPDAPDSSLNASETPQTPADDLADVEPGQQPAPKVPETQAAPENISDEILDNWSAYTTETKLGGLSDFNAASLETDEGVLTVIEAVSQNYAKSMDGAKRGTISNETTRQMADLLGTSPTGLLQRTLKLRPGEVPNHAEMLAMRDLMVWSGAKLDELALAARDVGSPDALLAFRKHLALHAQIQAKVKGAQTEIGRALQAFKIPAGAGGRFPGTDETAAMSEALVSAGSTPEATAELARRYLSLEDPVQRNAFARRGIFAKTYDAVYEVWMSAILSGPATHLMNAVGNGIMVFDDTLNRAVAAHMIPRVTGRQNVEKGETTAQLFGLYMALTDAVRASGKTFIDNAPPAEVSGSKIDFAPIRRNAFSAEGFEATGGVGKTIDLLGNVLTVGRFSSRTMEATDVFFKVIAERMERYAQAYRKTAGMAADARAAAMVDLINDPTPQMFDAQQSMQKYVTLQTELGPKWRSVQTLANTPVINYFLPFIKTPANSIMRGLERTPFAPMMSGVRETIRAGGPEADMALARIATGSTIMGIFATMSSQGLITGGGPGSKDVRAGWQAAGWQPYSIKVGNTYVSYARMEPYSTFLGLAADLGEISTDMYEAGVLDDPAAQEALQDIVTVLAFSMAENVTNKTFMEGTAAFMEAARDPQRYGGKAFENIFSGFVPNLYNQANRAMIDDQLRYTRGMIDALRKRVPGFSTELPPTYDVFGKPRTFTQIGVAPLDMINPFFMSKDKDGDAYRALVEYDVPLKRISEAVPGTASDLKLLPEQYSWLTMRAGERALEAVNSVMASEAWGKASWLGRRLMMREAIAYGRSAARQEVFQQFPVLQQVLRNYDAMKTEELRQ